MLFSFVVNTMKFNDPSHFFSKSESCYYAIPMKIKFSPLGSVLTSGLSDWEVRKLSRDRGAKRQTSAQSANAWATPGWPA